MASEVYLKPSSGSKFLVLFLREFGGEAGSYVHFKLLEALPLVMNDSTLELAILAGHGGTHLPSQHLGDEMKRIVGFRQLEPHFKL